VDAIAKMGRVLVGLEELDAGLRARPAHRLLGPASVHASLIHGGRELSSYPDSCVLSVERRTLPGEPENAAEAELWAIVEQLRQDDATFKADVRCNLIRAPLETTESAAIVGIVQRAAEETLHRPCDLAGLSFWTDAATLHAAGIPTVLFGPIGAGAHATEEWVDLASVRACAEVYLATAMAFCQ
jgi:acetylornithine deacetylase